MAASTLSLVISPVGRRWTKAVCWSWLGAGKPVEVTAPENSSQKTRPTFLSGPIVLLASVPFSRQGEHQDALSEGATEILITRLV
ncbi:hypothetical protein TYRP_002010 [Tyrophagus putrescentiae]|nr:hypothetical protein TYRP_002010 [Tyrophagus putrescentiae]